jgi:Tfp pilus assembly protein PilF
LDGDAPVKIFMVRLFIICAFVFLLAPVCASAHYEGELLPDSVAVMEYEMVLNMTPKDVLTRNKLGMVYIRQGKLDLARKEFTEILKIDPKNFDALDSLGMVSYKEGKYQEAAGWYEKALKIKSNAGVKQRLDAASEKIRDKRH